MFTGGGWGHGSGMCQTGAIGRAERGATYREILGWYYSGAAPVQDLLARRAAVGSGVNPGSPASPRNERTCARQSASRGGRRAGLQ